MKNIALLGNPNVGKTTLFNSLTGSNQRVGNWAGVTVDKKEGFFGDFAIVDLPGIYAMDTYSNEEKISKGKTPAQTSEILNDMHEYIENSIDGDLNLDNLRTVDFSNMGTAQVVEDALRDALSVFEKYYGED